MMKIFLFLFNLIILCTSVSAQEQQGIVKTRGRIINGQLVHGTPLSGAIVTLNIGNPLISANQGSFTFNVPKGREFSLVSVKKQGYVLADADYIHQTFRYSAQSPFYVILEDEAQRQEDINAANIKLRNTLKREIRKKEDELDALRENNAITQAKYDSLMRDFSEYRANSESLVKELAERYASIDYDQLDEFNRLVQMYIEAGELQKADSLIRSKGDMEKRISEYHRAVLANIQVRNQLEKSQHALQQSESGTRKTYEDLSRDLLSRSDIFLQEFKHDSALYCLKMRADLDTTNEGAVLDYAILCYIQKKYTDSELYHHICLSISVQKQNIPDIAEIQNNLGVLYNDLHDYTNSEKSLKLALENYEQLFVQNSDAYRVGLANTQNNLANLYRDLHDYTNSEKYYKLALENYEQLFCLNHDAYRLELAEIQNNLGVLYNDLHDYTNSEKSLKLALENYEQLFVQNSDAYRVGLANTQNNLANLYRDLHDYTNSEKYYKLALENYEQLFCLNHDAYRLELAETQNNLGVLYQELHDFPNSEKYLKLALEHLEQLFIQNPDAYREDLAGAQNNFANLYGDLHDYTNSEKYYKLVLENYEQLYLQNPDAYREDLAGAQNNLGLLYNDLHDYSNSEKYLKQALENKEIMFLQNPEAYRTFLATTQINLGDLYRDLHDYTNSEKYLKLAVENYEQLFLQNSDAYRAGLASVQNQLGVLYIHLDDFPNSEKYLKLALENYEQLFLQNSEAYREDLAGIQHNLALLYISFHDLPNSEKYLKVAKKNFEQLFLQNSNAYRKDLASTCWLIMVFYETIDNIEQYDSYLENSLNLFTELYSSQPDIYVNHVIDLQNRKVWRLLENCNVEEALNLSNETYCMDSSNETSKYYLAVCYNKMALKYAKTSDYISAYASINKAIDLLLDNASFFDTKGEIFLMEGKNEEALKMWKKVLEIEPNFMKEHPTGTNLSNGLKKLGLIE